MKRIFDAVCCTFLLVVTADFVLAQATLPLQHLWELHPDLGDIWSAESRTQSVNIDFDGLLANQADVRLKTARLISTNFDRPGFGDKTKAIEQLLLALERKDESIQTRRAMISAGCLLDDGAHAKELWSSSQDDSIANQEVQRALIRWRSDVALNTWRKLLLAPSAPAVSKRLAIQGLGACGTSDDRKQLLELLESESASIEYRLLAATALGQAQASGLVSLASKYLESNIPEREIIAVSLLNRHTDGEALNLMLSVYRSTTSPAKRMAALVLAEHSTAISEDLATQWISDPDPQFRELALRLTSSAPFAKSLEIAVAFLRDDEEYLRTDARHRLLDLAPLHPEDIDTVIERELHGDDWRSTEQAIILAADLGGTRHCEQLLELLNHPRAEVHMHAGWALRDLAERGPFLDRILEKTISLTNQLESEPERFGKSQFIMLSMLLETFGRLKHEPAFEMLEKYIPKNGFKMGTLSRASAIWAVGQIKKDVDDPDLRKRIRERINDLPLINPEHYLVRFCCILVLGEFGFKDSVEIIDLFGGSPPSPLGHASFWAKEQIKKSGK